MASNTRVTAFWDDLVLKGGNPERTPFSFLLDVHAPHGLGAIPPLPQAPMQALEVSQEILFVCLRGEAIDSWARVLPQPPIRLAKHLDGEQVRQRREL
jgi:hypothetical protein